MNYADRKFEISIFVLALIMIGGIFHFLKSPQKIQSQENDMVYEMPRPKAFAGTHFDLNGREIDRNYINPFAKKKGEDKVIPARGKTAVAKPAAKTPGKKMVAKRKAKTEDKKPGLEVSVVNDSPTGNSLSGEGGSGFGRQTMAQNPVTSSAQKTAENTDNTAQDKNSPDQWRSLISADPTAENVAKLIQAFIKGEVEQSTYVLIVSDLLQSSKSEVQALGIYAANYSYSAVLFALVVQKMSTLTGDNRAQAQGYLMSYANGNRLNALNSALRSSDPDVVIAAAEVVLQGYAQAKGESTQGRPGRGEGQNLVHYAQFIPVFQGLAQSSDPTIANLAQSALGQIQTTVASLSF